MLNLLPGVSRLYLQTFVCLLAIGTIPGGTADQNLPLDDAASNTPSVNKSQRITQAKRNDAPITKPAPIDSAVIVIPDAGEKWMDAADAIVATVNRDSTNRVSSMAVVTTDEIFATKAQETTDNNTRRSIPNHSLPDESDLVIAVGAGSLTAARSLQSHYLWSVLVTVEYATRQSLSHVKPNLYWVIDQPIARYFELIKLVLPKAQRVGILMSVERSDHFTDFAALNQNNTPKAVIFPVSDTKRTIASLKKALPEIDALLVIPDRVAVNNHTARGILLATYAKRIPVFAYSQSYVKAGALAGVFTQAEQIGEQVGTMLIQINHEYQAPRSARASKIYYPQDFDVATNPRVARSLDIRLPRKDNTVKHLRNKENSLEPKP